MIDPFGRSIRYVRISVTDRCNLRCQYCMPNGYLGGESPADILSYEEIATIAEAMVGLGVRKFRLTGGEPLVRRDLHVLVRMLRAFPEVEDLALSTNAVLLRQQAPALREAGLNRVNISLDTLNPETFRRISVNSSLDLVLDGIKAAEEVGLDPIKLNMVVMKGVNDGEIEDMARLTFEKPWTIRFIEVMPMRQDPGRQAGQYVSTDTIQARLERVGTLVPVPRDANAGPAREYRFEGARGAVGFITPLSHTFCATCNRVRMTTTGKLRLCLFGEAGCDLRAPLRAGASVEDLRGVILAALGRKPESHHLALGYSGPEAPITMSQIGG
ncbi:MAG: GTP 3',8-cyclase MoaA [Candidatus Eiseniibacteriota bacterium]